MKEVNKNHVISLLLVIIVVLGVIIASPYLPYQNQVQEAGDPATMPSMAMTVKTFNITAGLNAPTISFNIKQDSTGGWDLRIATTNFTFTPEKIDGAAVLGQGHIHLYVDNRLIVVLGPWYHLDPLPAGRHTIRAALANNDHSLYSVDGKYIDSTQIIDVK